MDHSYDHGLIALNRYYDGSPINQGLLDDIDNECITRLQQYGMPAEIRAWSRWRHPSEREIHQLHVILTSEAESSRRSARDNL